MTPGTEIEAHISALNLDPDEKRRIRITAGCRDVDYISKVPGAGEVFTNGTHRYQLMHNGVKVIEDCYCGKWMTELIKLLKGHHEPQEEKLFHEILKYLPPRATMVELGSYWGYYSLWFDRAIEDGTTYLIEPDPNHLRIGRDNFELNSATGHFFQYSVGKEPLPARPFMCESDGNQHPVAETSLDDFVATNSIPYIDLLLADIQGAELDMLRGAVETIKQKKLRFLFLSTHHHSISNDPLTHQRCRDFLREYDAHIIEEHNVTESFSGDGLIVASFEDRDRQISGIEISKNHPTNSLFRELEYDLADVQKELRAIQELSYRVRLSAQVRRARNMVRRLLQ